MHWKAARYTLGLMLVIALGVGALAGVIYLMSLLPQWVSVGIGIVATAVIIFIPLYGAVKCDMERHG